MPECEELVFRISKTTTVHVVVNGPVTQEAIDKMIAILELSKDTYPAASESE